MRKIANTLEVLEKYLGKGFRECNSKYRFRCYNCFSERSLAVNPSKERLPYICNSCGISGNIITLIRLFKGDLKDIDRLVYQPQHSEVDFFLMEKIYTRFLEISTLKPTHQNYILSRGINVNLTNIPTPYSMILRSTDYVVTNLLKDYSYEELAKVGLISPEGKSTPVVGFDRIVIFYFNLDKKCVYIRTRSVSPSKMRYLSPSGVSGNNFSWGWETYDKFSGYVIVTEGEFKAQAAKQLGFQCVALPGITTSHDSTAEIINTLNIPYVYILFDSDSGITPSGILKQYAIDQAAIKFSQKIKNSRVFLCKLPLLENSKMDIDTYVNIVGDNAKSELISILKSGKEITTFRNQ